MSEFNPRSSDRKEGRDLSRTSLLCSHSYDEAVELTGHGIYNYLALASCCVISNAVVMDLLGFSVVVAAATCDLQLGIVETGILASTPFAAVVFAFPWGYYADTRGRRRALLLSASVGFIMAALSSFSPNWQVMLVLKLLGCIFSTPAYNLTMTYLGECTGSLRRSRYLFYMNSANLGAEFIFYALAFFILPLDFRVEIPWLSITYRAWRLYTLVLAVPMGIGALMMLFLYESPKFLANRGDTGQALGVLRAMYRLNGGNENDYPVKALSTDNVECSNDDGSFWDSVVKQTVPLFKPPLLWRTLQLIYLITLCLTTNNVFLMWYPMMVNQFFNSFNGGPVDDQSFCQRVVSNITSVDDENYICNDTISTNTIYSGIILGGTFASLGLLSSFLAPWRRILLIGTFIISGVCLVLVDSLRNPIANMIVFTLIQITAIGIASVASYFVDLYPTTYRALVTGMGTMVSRLVSLGGVNLVGNVIVQHCSATFYGWTVYVCSGIVVALFLPADKRSPR